jgi:HK97 family phage portal protein
MKTSSEIAMLRASLVDSHGTELSVSKGTPNFEPQFFGGAFRMGTSQQYDEQKPYASHSTVYACAHKIATELKRIPLKLARRTDTSDKEEHIYKHPLLTSFKSPNPWMSRTTFWEAVVLALMLPTKRSYGGQVFLIPQSLSGSNVNLRKGEIPATWYPYNDEWVEPNMDGNKFINWKWRVPGNNTDVGVLYYEPEELIRIYNYNPYDPLHGLAPYVPVKFSVLQDAEASRFNYSFFKNNCLLTGLLTTDLQVTPQQRIDALRSWNELYAGSTKAGGTALLGNGLKYQDLGQKHLDMQFAEMKTINKNEVIAAYGLNELAFAELKSIPFSNVVEGMKMLWHDTYMVTEDHICESITEQWVQYIDPALAIEADYSEIPALKADLGNKVIIADQLINKCTVPAAEAFRLVGIDIDVDLYPWMLEKPVQAAQNSFSFGEKPEPKKVEQEPATPPEKDISKDIVNKSITDEHKQKNMLISEEYCKAVLLPGEKRMYKAFAHYFAQQRNQIMANVDKWTNVNKQFVDLIIKDAPLEKAPTAGDFLFDLAKENKKLMDEYKPLIKDQMKTTKLALDAELGGVQWNVTDDSVQAFAALRKTIVEGINTTTFDMAGADIEDVVASAMEEGLTVTQTAIKIKEKVQELYDVRLTNANVIARTETGSITMMTKLEAYKEEGIEYWEWITAKDDKVRESHVMVDGEVVRVGEPFSNGLMMPLDPDGDPEDTISCRCTTIYAEKTEGE